MGKLFLGLALSVTGLLLVPLSASAAEYETFVGCDVFSENPVPAHVCQLGDTPGAFFASDTEVEYEVCVEFPDTEELCSEENELAEAGVLYVNEITSNLTGNHLVTWYVEGAEVGAWEFRIDSPPPPPPPPAPVVTPTPAPAAAPLPVHTGPSAACLKARKRVAKLRKQLRTADGQQQILKIRSKLHSAQTAKKHAC